MILDILRHTPVWVYALAAWLTWMGLRRMRPRERSVRSLWILPAVFIAWGLAGLFAQRAALPLAPLWWLLAAALGGLIGPRLEPVPRIDRASGLAVLAGTPVPLLRNLAIFGAHYLLHVAAVLDPAGTARLMSWDVAVSGFCAGYFIGWGACLVRAWRTAPPHASLA